MTDDDRRDDDRQDDGWTGSYRKPWMNPPMDGHVGATRGRWRWSMLVVLVAIAAVFVVLGLVQADVLGKPWAYAMIPVALITAFVARLLAVFKTRAEDHPEG